MRLTITFIFQNLHEKRNLFFPAGFTVIAVRYDSGSEENILIIKGLLVKLLNNYIERAFGADK